MTLNQLGYYIEVVRQSNFTRAAQKLFVNQSTLSKSIRALENEFEVELINHSSKEFALTPEGHIFYEYAVEMLEHHHTQTQELYQRLHPKSGILNLGLPPTAGTIYFSSLLYKFRERYHDIDLKITEMTSKSVQEMVEAGSLDIGVVIEPFSNDKFFTKIVYTSEAVLVVSKKHALSSRRVVEFEELKSEQFLMVSPDYMFYDIVINHCKTAGFTPTITFESSQWDLLLEMVADNQGITILPKPIVEKLYSTRVRQIRLKNPEFPWALTIIYRKDKFITNAMQYFLDMCDEA